MRNTTSQDSKGGFEYSAGTLYVENIAYQEIKEKVQAILQQNPSLVAFLRNLQILQKEPPLIIRFHEVYLKTILNYATYVLVIQGIGVYIKPLFYQQKTRHNISFRVREKNTVKTLKINHDEYTSESLNLYDALYALLAGKNEYTPEKKGSSLFSKELKKQLINRYKARKIYSSNH